MGCNHGRHRGADRTRGLHSERDRRHEVLLFGSAARSLQDARDLDLARFTRHIEEHGQVLYERR